MSQTTLSLGTPLKDATHQHRLWLANLKFASALVRDYCYDPVLSQDALQEAKLALWEATFKWQEEMQDTFTHYAWLHMRRKLFNYLTEAATERPRLSRMERQILADLKKHLRAGELISCQLLRLISEETGINSFRLTQLVSYWYSGSLAISASSLSVAEELVSQEPEDEVDITCLEEGIDALPERERLIVISRYLQDPRSTLASLSVQLGVSIERVRQLEGNAFKKLRAHLEAQKA